MMILEIVLLASAALIAIWHAVNPGKSLLWISVILLCVLTAIHMVGGR